MISTLVVLKVNNQYTSDQSNRIACPMIWVLYYWIDINRMPIKWVVKSDYGRLCVRFFTFQFRTSFFIFPISYWKAKRGKDVNLWFPLNSKNENNHSPLSVIILHLTLQLKWTSSFLNLVVYSFSFCCLKQIDAVWVVASYQTEVVPSVTKKDQKANYFVFFFFDKIFSLKSPVRGECSNYSFAFYLSPPRPRFQ